MVGAPPDNIGAKRLAEDGVPASGAGSANMGTEKLDSDPNYPARTDSANHVDGRLRHQCHTRQPNKVAKMAP